MDPSFREMPQMYAETHAAWTEPHRRESNQRESQYEGSRRDRGYLENIEKGRYGNYPLERPIHTAESRLDTTLSRGTTRGELACKKAEHCRGFRDTVNWRNSDGHLAGASVTSINQAPQNFAQLRPDQRGAANTAVREQSRPDIIFCSSSIIIYVNMHRKPGILELTENYRQMQ